MQNAPFHRRKAGMSGESAIQYGRPSASLGGMFYLSLLKPRAASGTPKNQKANIMKTKSKLIAAFRLQRIVWAFACASLMAGTANAQLNYSDDFEGGNLNSFWIPIVNRGTVTFPFTAQSHSGVQSVELRGLEDGGSHLRHSLGASYGQVSLWVYDTGSDLTRGSSFSLNLGGVLLGTIGNAAAQYDYNIPLGSGSSENAPIIASAVNRTPGWHQFGVDSQLDSLTISIDGTQVYSGEGGHPITLLDFAVVTTSGHPSWSYQFDDFQATLVPVPEPSTVALAGIGAIVVLARRFRAGRKGRI